MAKLPWYMKEKEGRIHFHFIWIFWIYVKEKFNINKCDHNNQAWQGTPKKRICQKCGSDRTKKDGW